MEEKIFSKIVFENNQAIDSLQAKVDEYEEYINKYINTNNNNNNSNNNTKDVYASNKLCTEEKSSVNPCKLNHIGSPTDTTTEKPTLTSEPQPIRTVSVQSCDHVQPTTGDGIVAAGITAQQLQTKTKMASYHILSKLIVKNGLFHGITKELTDELVHSMYKINLKKDEFVIKSGQLWNDYFILESGILSVWRKNITNINHPTKMEKCKLYQYDSFGEQCLLFDSNICDVNIECISDNCTIWALDRLIFKEIRHKISNIENIKIQRQINFLKNIAFLSQYNNQDLKWIAQSCKIIKYNKGECIYRKGEKSLHFFIVSKGQCAVRRQLQCGTPLRLDLDSNSPSYQSQLSASSETKLSTPPVEAREVRPRQCHRCGSAQPRIITTAAMTNANLNTNATPTIEIAKSESGLINKHDDDDIKRSSESNSESDVEDDSPLPALRNTVSTICKEISSKRSSLRCSVNDTIDYNNCNDVKCSRENSSSDKSEHNDNDNDNHHYNHNFNDKRRNSKTNITEAKKIKVNLKLKSKSLNHGGGYGNNYDHRYSFGKTYKRGDYFGHGGIISGKSRNKTVIAITDSCWCFVMHAKDFNRIIKNSDNDKLKLTKNKLTKNKTPPFLTSQVIKYHSDSDSNYVSSKRRVNCKLNELKTIGFLGDGTFGKVTLVEDPNTSKTYSLKKLSKKLVVEYKQEKHTQNEKNILTTLKNKFVIRLYATYQDRLNVYFLTEAVLGGELFHLLKFNKCFDENTTKFYAACVVCAFDYLHAKNLIYRDLKTENVCTLVSFLLGLQIYFLV